MREQIRETFAAFATLGMVAWLWLLHGALEWLIG
jgi:hypothetical protein